MSTAYDLSRARLLSACVLVPRFHHIYTQNFLELEARIYVTARWSVSGGGAGVNVDLQKNRVSCFQRNSLIMDTYIDARVACRSIRRNRVQMVRRGSHSSASADDELCTLRIELRRVGLVQSKQLVADEVVAGRKVTRDCAGPLESL